MKRRPKIFSVTKAVKRNARDRVGTPRPEKVLPDEKSKAEHRAAKHKVTLPKLLHQTERD
ncbi:hypothetical protein [Terriglobus sp.]|uniref:hypothetical protein n=1 Tax=Terriglobus sp. TaxID=1889013 RepID=UPI003B00BF61